MADTFKDYMQGEDLDNVFLNPDEFAEWIYWDNKKVLAEISEVNSSGTEYEGSYVERKLVSVKCDSIQVKPAAGDQVNLNLDPLKVHNGDLWNVEKVEKNDGMYDVTFIRYAS